MTQETESLAAYIVLAGWPQGMSSADWMARLRMVMGAVISQTAVWYWDREQSTWVLGMVIGEGVRDRCKVFDVRLFADLSERWGYEWQVCPYVSAVPPAAPL